MGKANTYLSELIVNFFQAPKFHQIVSASVSEFIRIWVGENRLKKLISKPVEKSFLKSFDSIKQQKIIKEKIFSRWYESTDFGEIKDLVDNSKDNILRSISRINDELWQYPAKMLILFSFIPSFSNLTIFALKDQLSRLNALSPDLLCDIVLSFLREVDGKNIADLINELNEIARKLHIGSALLGEPGKPVFPQELGNFLDDVINTLDPKILDKAFTAFIEGKMTLEKQWTEILKKNPELFLKQISRSTAIYNSKIKSMTQKAELFESVSDEKLATSYDNFFSDLDITEFAEAINRFCKTANRIHNKKPELFSSMLTQFVNAVDEDEVQETLNWVIKDVLKILKPLAKELLPDLFNKEVL